MYSLSVEEGHAMFESHADYLRYKAYYEFSSLIDGDDYLINPLPETKMLIEFVPCNSLDEAKRLCPWACIIVSVDNVFHAFESYVDFLNFNFVTSQRPLDVKEKIKEYITPEGFL